MRKFRRIERGLIVGFWVAIALFVVAYRAFDPRFGEPGRLLPGEAAHAGIVYGIWAIMTPGIFWLVHRFGFEGGRRVAHIALHVAVAVIAAVTMNTFGHASFHALVDTGRSWSFSWTRTFYSFRFLDELIMYIAIVGAGIAREYFYKYRERHEEAGWLRAQLAEARLQALRMQIDPHFLFNTLHSISTHLERDPRAVRRMIARLSELLRYSLEMNDVKEVPLKQELRFIEGYLEIQTVRFPDTLNVSYDVAPETREALVPNLILQPVIENAIKHGVGALQSGGEIVLEARRDADRLVLRVKDNGPGLGATNGSSNGNGVGIRNTRERLEALYGDDHHFRLIPGEPSGLTVEMSIPYHTTADLITTAVTA